MPHRIQRRRTKGWRMPEGAVYVGRPSKWGNPFRVGERVESDSPLFPYLLRTVAGSDRARYGSLVPLRASSVVDAYLWWLYEQPQLMVALDQLRGWDLVCWCDPFDPCHAQALLELVNP